MTSTLYGASAEYGLHSLLILAGRKEPVAVRDLARFQRLPERFLAKLFTRLKKAGIVEGIEGSRGGFMLAREPEQISVMDVLSAIDPERSLFECAEIRRNCDLFEGEPPAWSVAGTCRIHLVMQEAEAALHGFLSSKTLDDLGCEFAHKAPKKFLEASEQWFQSCRSERDGSQAGKDGSDCKTGKACVSGKGCKFSRKK
jgi:Rrf2 family protein